MTITELTCFDEGPIRTFSGLVNGTPRTLKCRIVDIRDLTTEDAQLFLIQLLADQINNERRPYTLPYTELTVPLADIAALFSPESLAILEAQEPQ